MTSSPVSRRISCGLFSSTSLSVALRSRDGGVFLFKWIWFVSQASREVIILRHHFVNAEAMKQFLSTLHGI
jgi:hypothetical protein